MLQLVKLEKQYCALLIDMMNEWTSANEEIIPYAIRKADYRDYDRYLISLEASENDPDLVPDSTYFCLDTDRNILVGAVNIRHYLNDRLLLNSGHIGDGVRPSERRKGIGSRMVSLALEKCKELGIEKVLMVCDKENIASAKTIIHNGGILESQDHRQSRWLEEPL